MLTRPKASNGNLFWTQIGWSKWLNSNGFQYISVFTSYTDNAGHWWTVWYPGDTVSAGSYHYYYTYFTPISFKTTLVMDTKTFVSGALLNWQPSILQVYGETHNYNTQMPGDTSNKVLMDNAKYEVGSTWYALDAPAAANKTWYGATKNSSTSYSIWDTYCSTSGG